MTDVTTTPVTSGYNINRINNNFDALRDSINEDVIHSVGGNNTMSQDLDMNGHALLNLSSNIDDDDAMLTVGYAKDHFYQQHLVPAGVNDLDATNYAQVTQMVTAAAAGTFPENVALYSDLSSTDPAKGASLIGYLTGTVKSFLDSLVQTGTSVGSAIIGFIQGGTGAVATDVQSKLRQNISVKDFGAKGDGIADDTAAFNSAVAYAASKNGGVIHVPAGTYNISSTILVNSSGVVFQGDGFDTYHDAGSSIHATLLNWTGSAGGALIRFASIAGATNKCITGGGVLDIAMHGGVNRVGTFVSLQSHRGGRFRFYGNGSSDWILSLEVVSSLGEAEDTQYNHFDVWGRQFASGGGGILLTGNGNTSQLANTSFNYFRLVDLQINTGTGLSFGNADTNIFELVRIIGVSTGKAYEFNGSNASSSRTARGNYIKLLSSQGPGFAYGTELFGFPSVGNSIGLDTGNATPFPTVGTGASCYYNAGYPQQQWNPAFARMVLGDSVPAANTDRSNVGNNSLRIINGSQNHVSLTDGTNTWGINMSGGDLRIHLLSGSGTIRFGTFNSAGSGTINGYVTIKDVNGNTRKLATIA